MSANINVWDALCALFASCACYASDNGILRKKANISKMCEVKLTLLSSTLETMHTGNKEYRTTKSFAVLRLHRNAVSAMTSATLLIHCSLVNLSCRALRDDKGIHVFCVCRAALLQKMFEVCGHFIRSPRGNGLFKEKDVSSESHAQRAEQKATSLFDNAPCSNAMHCDTSR